MPKKVSLLCPPGNWCWTWVTFQHKVLHCLPKYLLVISFLQAKLYTWHLWTFPARPTALALGVLSSKHVSAALQACSGCSRSVAEAVREPPALFQQGAKCPGGTARPIHHFLLSFLPRQRVFWGVPGLPSGTKNCTASESFQWVSYPTCYTSNNSLCYHWKISQCFSSSFPYQGSSERWQLCNWYFMVISICSLLNCLLLFVAESMAHWKPPSSSLPQP